MNFTLVIQPEAQAALDALKEDGSKEKILKAVQKTLGLMQTNLRHQSLQTHKYDSLQGRNGEDVFEAYCQNNTPGAWRVFWHYGPGKGVLTVIAIVPHPD